MPFPSVSLYTIACLAVLLNVVCIYTDAKKKKNRIPLPPGPRPDPLIGNVRGIPDSDHHLFFYELGKTYGDVSHVNVLGRTMIIVNSLQAAIDLTEKRSANYSDRIYHRVFDCMGWSLALPLLRYGKRFQLHRRMFQQNFNKAKIREYNTVQVTEARLLAQNLIDNPGSKDNAVVRFATAVIMQVLYGHHVTSDEDPFVKLGREVGQAISVASAPGGTVIDFFPFLAYLPSWFPGTYYINHARKWAPVVKDMHDLPVQQVQRQMSDGTAKPSVVAAQLDALERDGGHSTGNIQDIKAAASISYFAGGETTSASLLIFILAMILHPECQAKAQAELDAVVGSQRLPDFSDRDNLPYLECILHETLRWHHPLPAGLPRQATGDDVYNGMFIPEGSIVVPNIRGITWDERLYANPFSFEPSRYLPAPLGRGEPRTSALWGFGRRICPGRHLGDSSLWIAMATILSTLSLTKAVDKFGDEITPEAVFDSSFTSRPKPFQYSVKPRSQGAVALLSQVDSTDGH